MLTRPSSPPGKPSTASGSSSSSSSSLTSGSRRLLGDPMFMGAYKTYLFLCKLYELVDDWDTDGVISWNDAGSGFIIHQPSLFEKDLLTNIFFNCHTLSAFVRHLTTVLGFVEAGGDQLEFSRNDFRRGRRPLFDVHDLVTSRNADPMGMSSVTVEEEEKEHMFDKVVTPSDVGKLNRLVIPKHHAEKYFPLLDVPSDEEKGLLLDFQDGNGKPWRFRYSYCNSSQCYVMTKGWSQFVKEKNLDAGDILSFQRGAREDSRHHLFIDLKRCPTIGTHPYSPMALHFNLNTSLQPVSELSCVTTEADEIETTNEDDNLTFDDSSRRLFIQRKRKLSLARFLQKMADRLSSEKRSAVGEDDEEQQLDHRSSTFSSVMDDALKGDSLQNICSSLEPIFRQLVREEVQHDLSKLGLVPLAGRSSANRIEGSDGRNLQLHFRTNLSSPFFTGVKVEGEQGAAVHVILLDANSGHVVTSGPESSIKLDVVALNGDFQYEDDEDWTQKEFQTHVVNQRVGRRPLLTGDLQVTLKEGVGTLGDLAFTDNSSWIRSGKLRLGLKVASGFFEGIRIREAKSEAFRVKDHRNESYKKHFPPLLNDEVWRLEKIAKNGVFHNRLNSHEIFTVEDFLHRDRSGEFPTTSGAETRRLLLSCAAENSDDLILQLVAGLESESIDEQKSAAMEIRLLARNKPENRLKIAKAGAIKPLVAIISSSDLNLQENGVTALLNLSLCDENKEAIASSGAIKPLVRALKTGTPTARENAACALLRLSQVEENKLAIGRSGAIAPLVDLLENGGIRGKKDAATALYSLCSAKENKVRAIQAGVMKPLVELMADLGSSMVDKAAFVLKGLVSVPEARMELVKEAGIPVLVEIVEVGTYRQKEIAVAVLLQVCEESAVFRDMVAREGAIPPVVALSQSAATSWSTKQKAETLVELLRQPRSGKPAARASEVSGLTNIEEVQGAHSVGCAGRKDRHSNVWTVKGDQDHPIPPSVHADSLTRLLGMRKLKVHNLFGNVPKSLPSIFQANSFVELHLPRYNHRLLWAGKLALVNLRLINLKHSSKLISLPDLSMAQKIVHLNLRGCVKLIQVSYIRNLTKLEKLNLSNCENIKVLPSLIGLQNLKEFYLSGCSNLWNLPPSIIALNSLVVLDLKNCAHLCELPRITGGLRSLQKLNISGCTNILRSLDMKGNRESHLSYGRFLNSTISGTYRYERASQFVEEATSPEQKKSTTKKAKKISAPEVVQVDTTVEKELAIKNFNWKAKMEKEERKRKSVESAMITCKEVRVKRICNNSDDFVSTICQPSHEAVEEAILDSGSKLIGDTKRAPPGQSPNLKENTLAGLAIEDPTSREGEDVGLGIQMEPEVISLCNSSDHPREECSERVQLDVSKTADPCGPHKFAEKSCDGGMESNTEVFSHQTIETEPLSSYEENDEIDWLKNEIQKLQEQLEASEKRRDSFRECHDSLESELWPLCAELEVEHVNLKEQKQKHEESELEASNAWEDLKNLVAQTIF